MKHRIDKLAVLASLGALLAGCGGQTYTPAPAAPAPPPAPAASNDLPPSALASGEALVAYMRNLALTETGQPLRVDGAQLPASETAEPVGLPGA